MSKTPKKELFFTIKKPISERVIQLTGRCNYDKYKNQTNQKSANELIETEKTFASMDNEEIAELLKGMIE